MFYNDWNIRKIPIFEYNENRMTHESYIQHI